MHVTYYALSLEFMNLLGIYTVGVARSLCKRLLLDIVIVNCYIWLPLFRLNPPFQRRGPPGRSL